MRHHLIKQATKEFSNADESYGFKQCGKMIAE